MWIRAHGSGSLDRIARVLQADAPDLEILWAGDRGGVEASLAVGAHLLAKQSIERDGSPAATLIELRSVDHFDRADRRMSFAAVLRHLAKRGVAASVTDELRRQFAGTAVSERAALVDGWCARPELARFRYATLASTGFDQIVTELARLPGKVALIVPHDLPPEADALVPNLLAAARAADLACIELARSGEDDRERLACHVGQVAAWLDLGGDSPLRRPLRSAERKVHAGRAKSLERAREWLGQVVSARHGDTGPRRVPDSFVASYVERLTPAMMPLSAMNTAFRAGKRYATAGDSESVRGLLAFTQKRCSDERYAAAQDKFLNFRALYELAGTQRGRAGVAEFIHAEKYLDLPTFAVDKLGIANKLQLSRRSPLTVLDLGAGSGHFGLSCEYFGHRYVGLDIPFPFSTSFSEHDLYAELFECFGLHRVLQRIVPFTPLQVPHRFELVTCMMGVFCTYQNHGAVAWQWPEWQFFLHDLVHNVVTPRFEVYLNIARQYLPAQVQAHLTALGANIDARSSVIRFTHEQADQFANCRSCGVANTSVPT